MNGNLVMGNQTFSFTGQAVRNEGKSPIKTKKFILGIDLAVLEDHEEKWIFLRMSYTPYS